MTPPACRNSCLAAFHVAANRAGPARSWSPVPEDMLIETANFA